MIEGAGMKPDLLRCRRPGPLQCQVHHIAAEATASEVRLQAEKRQFNGLRCVAAQFHHADNVVLDHHFEQFRIGIMNAMAQFGIIIFQSGAPQPLITNGAKQGAIAVQIKLTVPPQRQAVLAVTRVNPVRPGNHL